MLDYYKEINKCKNDIIYFIEHYCKVNNNSIKLKDYQIAFIKYMNS